MDNNFFFCIFLDEVDMKMVINSKKDIYIDLAFLLNKLVLDDNFVTYELYKEVQDDILKNF